MAENLPDLALDQAGLSFHTETIIVEPTDLAKTMKRYPIVLLYMQGVSEQVRRIMRGYRLKVYFKLINTLVLDRYWCSQETR